MLLILTNIDNCYPTIWILYDVSKMRSLVSANAPPYKQHPYHLHLSETLFRSLIFVFQSLVLFQKQNMLKLAKILLKLVSSCFSLNY